MAVKAVVFDVGETLVDETGMWTRVAEAGGVTPFTLMAGLGATIALERSHDEVWSMLGIEHPGGTWTMDDWYPDARPCRSRQGSSSSTSICPAGRSELSARRRSARRRSRGGPRPGRSAGHERSSSATACAARPSPRPAEAEPVGRRRAHVHVGAVQRFGQAVAHLVAARSDPRLFADQDAVGIHDRPSRLAHLAVSFAQAARC